MRVEHELNIDSSSKPDEVVNISQEQLKFFWELLYYQRGVSLLISQRIAEKIESLISVQPKCTGVCIMMSDAKICVLIKMPDSKLFERENNRLSVWLRLASEARNSKSSVDAIRNYYMILEDLYSSILDKEAIKELKFVRDFVSHGEKLGNSDLLKFIKDQFGKSIDQFDPTDTVQQNFVDRYRTLGRNLVEKELNKSLGL